MGLELMLSAVLAGARLELYSTSFSPSWFWERVQRGDVSMCGGSPAVYKKLANYFDNSIRQGPASNCKNAVDGVCNVRIVLSAGSRSVQVTTDWWQKLRRGKPLLGVFGTTETFAIVDSDWKSHDSLASVSSSYQFLHV